MEIIYYCFENGQSGMNSILNLFCIFCFVIVKVERICGKYSEYLTFGEFSQRFSHYNQREVNNYNLITH